MTLPFAKLKSRLGLIALIFIAFISLGLPDGLLGVAWPSVRSGLSLPLDALGILLIATTAGYLTSSFFSGPLIHRFGVGRILAASCALTGIGLLGYTWVPAWWMMVGLGVVAGMGAGAIDAGLNTYVASHFGEDLMQWLHASYGVGVTLGPLVMTLGLAHFNSWRWGYVVVGLAQLALAVSFVLTLSMWKNKAKPTKTTKPSRLTDYKTPLSDTLTQPAVWLNLSIFFLYTGIEVTLGVWTYSLLTESRGITPTIAGLWAGSYWAMFTVGRISAGLYTRLIANETLVRFSLFAALGGSLLLWWNPISVASLLSVAIVGLAIAPVFPALVTSTRARVGAHHTANTIGMQISSAGIGAAAVPGLVGALARRTTLEVIPLCLVVAFAILLGLHRWSTTGK